MTKTEKSQPNPPPEERSSSGGLIVWLCVLTVVGLTIADFADDGRIDRFLIGGVLVLAFGFAGKVSENFFRTLVRAVVERWSR